MVTIGASLPMGTTRTGEAGRARALAAQQMTVSVDVGAFRCSDLVRCRLWCHLAAFQLQAPALLVASTLAFAIAAAIAHLLVGAAAGRMRSDIGGLLRGDH